MCDELEPEALLYENEDGELVVHTRLPHLSPDAWMEVDVETGRIRGSYAQDRSEFVSIFFQEVMSEYLRCVSRRFKYVSRSGQMRTATRFCFVGRPRYVHCAETRIVQENDRLLRSYLRQAMMPMMKGVP